MHGIVSFKISVHMAMLAGGLTSGRKKSHIWLFHVASVVMVKQQDGDKNHKIPFFKFQIWALISRN
jgi:hypothetical protein